MFRLSLFKIRAFTAGNIAGLLGALGRGGIQFMLIIWLQGIWLPQHGYSFSRTPLWAGIAMIPLTVGFLIVGPLAGWLSDRHGARLFATTGLAVSTVSFLLLELLPIGSLFSAFLGYNPIKELLGPTGALSRLSPAQASYITGRSFFPHLIEQPFAGGLHLAFTFAAGATVIAIVASALRGKRYVHP